MTKRKSESEKAPVSIIDEIQEELNLSDLEMEGIANFTKLDGEYFEIEDVLNKIVQDENLNVKQKVALSHTLGMFRVRAVRQEESGVIVIEVPKFQE